MYISFLQKKSWPINIFKIINNLKFIGYQLDSRLLNYIIFFCTSIILSNGLTDIKILIDLSSILLLDYGYIAKCFLLINLLILKS